MSLHKHSKQIILLYMLIGLKNHINVHFYVAVSIE